MDCINNNIEIIKRQNNFICTFKMAYNNTCNSINTGYSPFFVRLKKESKIIKYTYTKQHKHSNPVPVLLSNYYFLYKVIYNPAILFIPTNPNSDYPLMYGGLASAITGGNFLEGAAIGLVVTALNHALHEALDPDPKNQQKGNKEKVKNENKEKNLKLHNPTGGDLRGDDQHGSGHYLARRKGGRPHLGIDILSDLGQNVVSPIDGIATNFIGATSNIPMVDIIPNDNTLGIQKIRILYVNENVNNSSSTYKVFQGQTSIGTNASLPKLGYPSGIRQHIHLQIQINNKWVNPTKYFY